MPSTTTTEHGLPIDESFAAAASEDQLQRAAAGLAARGLVVEIVDDVAAARRRVNDLLPTDRSIFTAGSETLRLSGLAEDINDSGRFVSARQQIGQLDFSTQYPEMKRLGALPDVVIGSVHAITEDGRAVITSMTGSQLGPYAAGADKVIWVVGAQKVVADLETALRRVQLFALPKEDGRARSAYGIPSAANKTLIVDGEATPGRITVVLVREALGF
jgi:acyl-CoA hydrolase